MFHLKSSRVVPKTVVTRRHYSRSACGASPWARSGSRPRSLLSGSPLNPAVMNASVPMAIGFAVSGNLGQGGADFYEIQPNSDGRLIAQTIAGSNCLELRLSIYDGQGNLLVQSDGQSSGRLDPLIDQHVAAGSDFLEVQSLSGSGSLLAFDVVDAVVRPRSNPRCCPPISKSGGYAPLAVGDFTSDGILDIVAPDGVHLGTGDGTFQAAAPASAGRHHAGPVGDGRPDPSAIAVGDFNNDHKLDVAIALAYTDSISISLGNGDGTFQPALPIDRLVRRRYARRDRRGRLRQRPHRSGGRRRQHGRFHG